MKFLILVLIGAAQAITSYPYIKVSNGKAVSVKQAGGSLELEPLETGSMKTLPSHHDLTKDIVRDAFKERVPDSDSIEERIKWASRNYGAQEHQ